MASGSRAQLDRGRRKIAAELDQHRGGRGREDSRDLADQGDRPGIGAAFDRKIGDDLVREEQAVEPADGKRHRVGANSSPRPVRPAGSDDIAEAIREKPPLLREEETGRQIERDPRGSRERSRVSAPGALGDVPHATANLQDAVAPGPDPPRRQLL